MNDQTQDLEIEQEDQIPSELDTLRGRADQLGIDYRHNTGVEKLRKLVNAKLTPVAEEVKVPATQTEQQKVAQIRKEAAALVRIRVTCMNPNKKNWEGEIFSVGSAKLGTFKKFVPFDAPDGWHVPQIIFNMIKERKCSIFYNFTSPSGAKSRKSKLVPEFSIDILPALTEKELNNLARQQALTNDE
tara:strand:- start:207 stop:767 length:561 start_codon:yes stop_codon:yes gene_type:complete